MHKLFLLLFLSITLHCSAQDHHCPFCGKTWKNTVFSNHITQGAKDTLMAFSLRMENDKTFKATLMGKPEVKGTFIYHAQHRKLELHYEHHVIIYNIKGIGDNILALEGDDEVWPQRLLLEPSENISISTGLYTENDSLYTVYIPAGWKINDESSNSSLFSSSGNDGIIINIDSADYPDAILRNTLTQMNLSTRYIIKSGLIDTPNRLHGKFLILRTEENNMIKFFLLQDKDIIISIICITQDRTQFATSEAIFDRIANSFHMQP